MYLYSFINLQELLNHAPVKCKSDTSASGICHLNIIYVN